MAEFGNRVNDGVESNFLIETMFCNEPLCGAANLTKTPSV